MSKKIIAIVGSYRKGHITDKIVDEILEEAKENGAKTEKIYLLDKNIEFCTNCRDCCQEPGEKRGECIHKDDFSKIMDKVDSCDGLILASPVNFSSATAITKRFIERLISYAYMPWGSFYPRNRIKKPNKKAVLVTASTAPTFYLRLFMDVLRQLGEAAKVMGAKRIGYVSMGFSSVKKDDLELKKHVIRKAKRMGRKLAAVEFHRF